MNRFNRAEEESWIVEYIRAHPPCVDVCNNDFCEAFTAKFGGATFEKLWGANPAKRLGGRLSRLASSGQLKRWRVGMPSGNWQPGFPRWVWSYTLH